jgi:hypothetical protein
MSYHALRVFISIHCIYIFIYFFRILKEVIGGKGAEESTASPWIKLE